MREPIVSKGGLRREDPSIVPIAEEAGQTVEVFHLSPEFIRYLDRLVGMVDAQADGYADLFVQRRKMVMEQVQVQLSYRKGYNF